MDTGANVSLISKSALKPSLNTTKLTIPVKSSSGDLVKILGSLPLHLATESCRLEPHHFWITDQTFPRYAGIIGTDLLSNLHATIQCREKVLQLKPTKYKLIKIPLHYPTEMEGITVSKANPVLTNKLRNQCNEVRAACDQEIPPWSMINLECRITRTPWLNLPHALTENMISLAGVCIGRAWVKMNTRGYFPAPAINVTDQPFKIKNGQVLTQAIPLFPGDLPDLAPTAVEMEALDVPGEGELSSGSGDEASRQLEPGRSTLEGAMQPSASTSTSVGASATDAASARQDDPAEGCSMSDSGEARRQRSNTREDEDDGRREEESDSPGGRVQQANGPTQETTQGTVYTSTNIPGTLRHIFRRCEDGVGEEDHLMQPEDPGLRATEQRQATLGHGAEPDTPQSVCEYLRQRLKDQASAGHDVPPTEKYLTPRGAVEVSIFGPEPWDTSNHHMAAIDYELALPQPSSPFMVRDANTYRTRDKRGQVLVAEPYYHNHTETALQENYLHHHPPPESVLQNYMRRQPSPSASPPAPHSLPAESNRSQAETAMTQRMEQAVLESDLPPQQQGELRSLLFKYQSIFKTTGDHTQSCPLFTQAIELTDDIPVYTPQYPLPHAAREGVKECMKEFLAAGIIKPSKSPYNSPIWAVEKADRKSWRPVVDYRNLNKKVKKDPYPLPRIDEMLECFHNVGYMSNCDLYWGFYQVRVRDEDTHKLAFTTDEGRFEYTHLPMGLKTAPAVFQRLMNYTFTDYLKKFVLVYMDDLIIYSPNAQKHFEDVEKIFERMANAGLRFKIDKCNFFKKELKFLGFKISTTGVSLDPDKVKSVLEFPRPDKDVGSLQSFLGLVGYFKRHIPDYAKIARPLYKMLKGEETTKKKRKGTVKVPYKVQSWGPEQEEAFIALKKAATTAPVLAYPDFSRDFILTTDASDYAIGYVLSQEFPDGEHPIAYGSRLLRANELNYGNTDREMLAIREGADHFRPYLYGHHFIIRTDHQATPLIDKRAATTRRSLKWLLDMEDYSYDIVHVPATRIKHADALSRIRWPEKSASVMMFEQGRTWLPTWSYEGWAAAQLQDNSLADMIKMAQSPQQNIFTQKDGILYKLVDGRYCSVVPTIFRKRLMKQFHDLPARGHQGPDRTYQAMKYYFFWPNMRLEILNFIERCFLCQKHKRSYMRVPLQHQIIPKEPFHTVSVDLVGPVVRSEKGEEYILVMQDMLTRWVELAALKHTNAEAIMEKFRIQWIMRYGPPERLLSDRGSNFISQFALEYCRFYGIDKIHTTAYRPEGNGANERMHAELARFFRIYLDDQEKSKWSYLLEYAAYAYNTSYHTGLGTSPYEALFGRLPPLGPLSVPLDPKDPINEANFYRFIGMRRRELFQKRKMIQEALLKAQNQQLSRKNRFARYVPFQVGDHVFYKNHNPRTKWDPKFTGPWRIIDQISPVVFELDLDGKRFTAHAAHLKLYKEPVADEVKEQPEANYQEQEERPEEEENNDYEQVFIPPVAVRYRRPAYEPSYDLDNRLGRSFRNLFRLPGSPRSPDQEDSYTPPNRGVRHALKKIFRAPARLAERIPLSERPSRREIYDAGASPSSEFLRRGDCSRAPPDRYSDSNYSRR